MRRYASIFPELALFDSDAEAEQALARVHKQPAGWRWCAAIPLLFVALMLGLYAAARVFLEIWSGVFHLRVPVANWILLTAVPAAVAAALAPLMVYCAARRRYSSALRRILQEKGVPVCITCGYDCRGLTEPRCPECGRPFDARLLKSHSDAGSSDPR